MLHPSYKTIWMECAGWPQDRIVNTISYVKSLYTQHYCAVNVNIGDDEESGTEDDVSYIMSHDDV